MAQNRLEGNLYVTGNVSAQTVTLPNGTVGDAAVKDNAGIDATKLQHQHRVTFAQESGSTAIAEGRVLHHVRGATGSVVAFAVGCVTPCIGDAAITVDLKNNGASILTAPIELGSGQDAFDTVAGTIASAGLLAGDVLEIVITVTPGTGTLGEGLFAALTIHEKAQ
jgi:hypothetical protein